jgi:hypothetical protein
MYNLARNTIAKKKKKKKEKESIDSLPCLDRSEWVGSHNLNLCQRKKKKRKKGIITIA